MEGITWTATVNAFGRTYSNKGETPEVAETGLKKQVAASFESNLAANQRQRQRLADVEEWINTT